MGDLATALNPEEENSHGLAGLSSQLDLDQVAKVTSKEKLAMVDKLVRVEVNETLSTAAEDDHGKALVSLDTGDVVGLEDLERS